MTNSDVLCLNPKRFKQASLVGVEVGIPFRLVKFLIVPSYAENNVTSGLFFFLFNPNILPIVLLRFSASRWPEASSVARQVFKA